MPLQLHAPAHQRATTGIPQAELAAIQDPWHRLKRITSICRLLLDALAGRSCRICMHVTTMALCHHQARS